MPTKTKSRTLSNRVTALLLAGYARGVTAWNEEKLASHFQVSRTPIREALRDLEREGLVIRRQKRGICLRRPSAREITEVYDVRAALEKLAIGLAADRVTPADARALDRIVRACTRASRAGNAWRLEELDLRFHTRILGISGNRYLKRLMERFHLLVRAFQLSGQVVSEGRPEERFRHADIVAALRRGDRRTCETLIDQHIQGSKRRLLECLRRGNAK